MTGVRDTTKRGEETHADAPDAFSVVFFRYRSKRVNGLLLSIQSHRDPSHFHKEAVSVDADSLIE
jgi:hypothetical protein